MVGILIFSNWGAPNDFRFELKNGTTFRAAISRAPENPGAPDAIYRVKMLMGEAQGTEVDIPADQVKARTPLPGAWTRVWRHKWHITAVLSVLLGIILVIWFGVPWWKVAVAGAAPLALSLALPTHGLWVLLPFGTGVIGLAVVLSTTQGEMQDWLDTSWTFAKQILPLLFGGVVLAGLLLGRVGHEGLIPSSWVAGLVGGNSLWANFFASVVGAFMYFATLTEVPILQGLIGAGMGKGPALALLLAGPALSLPNMLVIRSIMGTQKTVVFVLLVIVMATMTGMVFGAFAA
jgi:uncharacterized membrane protein YraQ (UPF0718 family)